MQAKTLAMGLLCVGSLVGCGSAPKVAPAQATSESATTKPQVSQAPAASVTSVSTVTPASIPDYLDAKSAISTQRSVYFDFDDSSVKKEFTPLIELQAKYLMKNPTLKVKVEGNTDERGSAEYNLALGQRRAESVAKALRTMGVKDAQVEAISFGEEKPKAQGHDESAWTQNRRADIAYPNK